MTFIKICGITSYADAKAALDLGVDALGFNLSSVSPRALMIGEAQAITRRLPPAVWRVGVFVNQGREEVEQAARQASLDTLQFHGDETIEFCRGWSQWRVLKAIRCKPGIKMEDVTPYTKVAERLLFDGFSAEKFGGTGNPIPEELLAPFVQSGMIREGFLAGGLTPENIEEKVKIYRPFGVDVASGVEYTPRKKDPVMLREFVDAVRKIEN